MTKIFANSTIVISIIIAAIGLGSYLVFQLVTGSQLFTASNISREYPSVIKKQYRNTLNISREE
jgi:hypothetical protein